MWSREHGKIQKPSDFQLVGLETRSALSISTDGYPVKMGMYWVWKDMHPAAAFGGIGTPPIGQELYFWSIVVFVLTNMDPFTIAGNGFQDVFPHICANRPVLYFPQEPFHDLEKIARKVLATIQTVLRIAVVYHGRITRARVFDREARKLSLEREGEPILPERCIFPHPAEFSPRVDIKGTDGRGRAVAGLVDPRTSPLIGLGATNDKMAGTSFLQYGDGFLVDLAACAQDCKLRVVFFANGYCLRKVRFVDHVPDFRGKIKKAAKLVFA